MLALYWTKILYGTLKFVFKPSPSLWPVANLIRTNLLDSESFRVYLGELLSTCDDRWSKKLLTTEHRTCHFAHSRLALYEI